MAESIPPNTNIDESRVPQYRLPALLNAEGDTPITTRDDWETLRRPGIYRAFEQQVYGRMPGPPEHMEVDCWSEEKDIFAGLADRKQRTVRLFNRGRKLEFELLLYLPSRRPISAPCFLGLNFFGNHTIYPDPAIRLNDRWVRERDEFGIIDNRATDYSRGILSGRWPVEAILRRGYALATLYYGDLDPDNYRNDFSDGIHPLFYKEGQTQPEPDEWGAISAWAWGLSRAMDVLAEDPGIDAERVAVMGHSRLGKTALWAGASDPRFALVISNNSGCGGASLFRRCFGETIRHITDPVPYWFCRNFYHYRDREDALPVDQHMLIALAAPRPVYVTSATHDLWADPKGEFLAAREAGAAYRLYGKNDLGADSMPPPFHPLQSGSIGYHLRAGKHDVTLYDWERWMDFADRHLA